MYTLNVDKIRKATKFYLDVDEDAGILNLRGVCKVKDTNGKVHTYRQQIDLVPMVQTILDRMQSYPATIAAEDLSLTIDHAGGWLSETYGKASRIARNIGENRIAQDIYRDVLPEVAPFIPGASAALSIANKAHAVVVNMREGSHQAVEQAHHVAEAAQAGSGAARQVLSVMKRMGQMLKMKAEYKRHENVAGDEIEDVGRVSVPGFYDSRRDSRRRPKRAAPPRRRDRSRPTSSVQPGTREHRRAQEAQEEMGPQDWTQEAQEAQSDMEELASTIKRSGWTSRPPQCSYVDQYGRPIDQYGQPCYPPQYARQVDPHQAARDAYFESLFEGSDEQVEGWLYNKPYRDPLTAISQINKDPFFISRMLYNEGLDVSKEINRRRSGKR